MHDAPRVPGYTIPSGEIRSPQTGGGGAASSTGDMTGGATAATRLLGAEVNASGAGVRFGIFASADATCAVRVFAASASPDDHATFPMTALGDGYFEVEVPGLTAGALYKFVVNGNELPDPYARFLPRGVHGPALVTDRRYQWRNGEGVGRPLGEHVVYEIHVGTFSERGDYQGVKERLPQLAALGITAIELMPLAAFSGERGWGYDGVAPFAPFAAYGTPDELRSLIDEAHGLGLAVILDAVYNHFGPTGNYLRSYCADCFTSKVRNAWGDSLDYAHPVMRRLVLDSALYWLDDFRFDGLRLDATHAILDPASSRHVLRELADRAGALRPRKLLIAEDDRNDPAIVTDTGCDGVWADDFHHQLFVTLTGERDGYYAAYEPGLTRLAKAVNEGWLYQGEVFPLSGKCRGCVAESMDAPAFVYCVENHDQVGNRALGERFAALVSAEQYRAASTLLLFLPMTPLLFMGQEWAASTPFLYFTDHDAELGRLVSEGRREEFKSFTAFANASTRETIPDPQDPRTFERSRLNWQERDEGEHGRVLALYQTLLALRRSDPVLRTSTRQGLSAEARGDVLVVDRTGPEGTRRFLMNFASGSVPLADLSLPGSAKLVFASDGGQGDGGSAGFLPPATAHIWGWTAGS